jgi:DNA polymerase Ligase (LigD)
MDDRSKRRTRRFVLLKHEIPESAINRLGPSHWDLMLENHGKLLTWRLFFFPKGEITATWQELKPQQLADHRIEYLHYEGPISGDRGAVYRVDAGEFRLPIRSPGGRCSRYFRLILAGKTFQLRLDVPASQFAKVRSFEEKSPLCCGHHPTSQDTLPRTLIWLRKRR